jgi:hypothetical protein
METGGAWRSIHVTGKRQEFAEFMRDSTLNTDVGSLMRLVGVATSRGV